MRSLHSSAWLQRTFGIKERDPSHQLTQLNSVEVITHSFKASVAKPIFNGQRWRKIGISSLARFFSGQRPLPKWKWRNVPGKGLYPCRMNLSCSVTLLQHQLQITKTVRLLNASQIYYIYIPPILKVHIYLDSCQSQDPGELTWTKSSPSSLLVWCMPNYRNIEMNIQKGFKDCLLCSM